MDAQRAANVLGIPYYVWDFSEKFKTDVVDDFIAEYQAGRTPNPCMRCNEKIKFAALLDKAARQGLGQVQACTEVAAMAEQDGHIRFFVRAQHGSVRQVTGCVERVNLKSVGIVGLAHPGQGVKRQAVSHG